jgi:2-methylisocitrate lyase-like PEP mutase family enzyme
MSDFHIFQQLHQQENMFHIGNVWDIPSALMFEKAGYQALGTSSAAIADTLGHEDGEQMPFDTLVGIVTSIIDNVSIPLSVDIEAGYSRDIENVIGNIIRLANIGVVGINLEDSVVNEEGNRQIVDALEFSQKIQVIKAHLYEKKIDVFLNIRTDSFIMGLDKPQEKAIERAKLYEHAGADGIFIPCVVNQDEIKQLVDCVSIPLNVMAMPTLPSFSILENIGVKRVSSGPFVYNKVKAALGDSLQNIKQKKSFLPLFE